MKGRNIMEKVTEAVKNDNSGLIKTVIICITCAATLAIGGARIGQHESEIKNVCKTVLALAEKMEKHETIIDEMRRKAARQEGIVDTTLASIQKEVGKNYEAIKEIKDLIITWEPTDGEDN